MASTPIDWSQILVQAPVVAIFVWFVLRLNDAHQKVIDRLTNDNRSANVTVMTDWRNYLKDRDEQWRLFLVEQRESMNDSLDAMSQQIGQIATVVSELDHHMRSGNNVK